MSNDNGFDDLVRKKLEAQEEEVSPFSWGAVEKELPQQVKRSAFLRKRYLVLLLLLVSVTGYYFSVKTNTDNAIVQKDADKNLTATDNTSSNTIVQSSSSIANKTKNKVETGSELNTASVTEKETANTNSINAPEANENQSSAKPIANKPIVSKNAASIKASVVVASNNSSEGLQSGESLTPTLSNTISTSTEITEVDYLSALLYNNNDEGLLIVAPESASLIKVTLPPVKERKTMGLFLEGFYSPDFSSKKMTNNNADESYLRLRKNTERYFYSHSMGIRVGYNLTSHISIKTGYDHTEVQERLSYSYIPGTEEAIKMGLTVDSISGTLIDPLSSSGAHDTIIGNYSVTGEVTVSNHYKYYNIPFIINYEAGKSKLKWTAGAGTFLNVGLKTKGSIINRDRVTRINLASNKEQNPYKSSLGMGISAELIMVYELRKNVSFLAGPHAKFYFGNISKSDAPLNERFFNWGILTGLKVAF